MQQSLQPARTLIRPLNFFALTFILSWVIWIPLVLFRLGLGSVQPADGVKLLLSFLGVLMPAISALILTALAGETRGLLSRMVLWRVNWKWWAVAALGQPSLLALTELLYRLIFGKLPVDFVLQGSVSGLVVNLVFLLLATLGEEIGWRGLALPALQLRHNALKASLILAVIYIVWHTPYWLVIGTLDKDGLFYIGLNYLFAFPTTFYVTWFSVRGKFSILLAVAFHVFFNVVNIAILPVTANVTAYAMLIAFEWIIAFLMVPALKSEQIASRA